MSASDIRGLPNSRISLRSCGLLAEEPRRTQGRSLDARPPAADGAEQAGSQAYVPPHEKDDKALNAAFNLLRGVTVNVNAPVMAKRAVPN